ncbi:MAG: hypothetical protein EA421_00535 [Gemmatimonadales bacterium]|nr:MAG: hypothetical protein EA421_00535 [Gemmatimonadales bacterium]
MKPRRWAPGLVLIFLLLTASCWPWREGGDPFEGPSPEDIRLEVVNQHFNDVAIYLIPNGQQRRIGVVTGLTTESLGLEGQTEILTRPFRLAAAPIGSREEYVSDPINAFPGDEVVLTLTSRIRMSHWHVR